MPALRAFVTEQAPLRGLLFFLLVNNPFPFPSLLRFCVRKAPLSQRKKGDSFDAIGFPAAAMHGGGGGSLHGASICAKMVLRISMIGANPAQSAGKIGQAISKRLLFGANFSQKLLMKSIAICETFGSCPCFGAKIRGTGAAACPSTGKSFKTSI